MLSDSRIRELLQPFGVELDPQQQAQLKTYLDLLLRWNRTINLTSIRDPEQIVVRHFGESLFVQSRDTLDGDLLDIGSGAGFPGLALKIVLPGIPATLLEPIAKKRAFLKEVIRSCGMTAVEVRPERLEEMIRLGSQFRLATARAVGAMDRLAAQASEILAEGGALYLWTTRNQSQALGTTAGLISWTQHLAIPLSREREILIGVRKSA